MRLTATTTPARNHCLSVEQPGPAVHAPAGRTGANGVGETGISRYPIALPPFTLQRRTTNSSPHLSTLTGLFRDRTRQQRGKNTLCGYGPSSVGVRSTPTSGPPPRNLILARPSVRPCRSPPERERHSRQMRRGGGRGRTDSESS